MKTIIFIALIALVAADCDYYQLDDLDINEIINNTDEFKRFYDCVMDLGECSELYGVTRAVTPEAVETACKNCSSYQKHIYWQFLDALKTSYPTDYDNYRHKYDPNGLYFDALMDELVQYSINY